MGATLYNNFSLGEANFTNREVDILACVSQKRKEKKIAEILSISPRTVETHIVNIRTKLGCCSKDSLIDSIEKSDKILYLKNHYCNLLINKLFSQKLLLAKEALRTKEYTIGIQKNYINKETAELGKKISTDLTKIGINLFEDPYEQKEKNSDSQELFLVFLPSKHQNKRIHITTNKNIENIEYIDFIDTTQYMQNFFHLVQKITSAKEINNIITDYSNEVKNLKDGLFTNNVLINKTQKLKINQSIKSMKLIAALILLLTLSSITMYIFFHKENTQKIYSGDLTFPQFYLERKQVLKQMDKLLSTPKKINTIALVGMGGSGKTTLAMQYADKQNASLVWKVDAETPMSTMISLEGLAYSLCKTPAEKEEFYNIQKIEDFLIKEYMLGAFLKTKAPLYKKWIMIYDNVTNFSDIQILLPHDIKAWGSEGKVIITTANSNIINNNYFSNQNIIYIPELNQKEKNELYSGILNKTDPNDPEIEFLLKKIPPFPLDIVQAAFYIKNTGIKLNEYIQHITKKEDGFLKLEKSILNNISNYTHTRNTIIELSLKQIKQQEFAEEILLFLSLLDTENIPKKLLIAYKGEVVINEFLREMRRFSLIKENNAQESRFSLHKSIHSKFLSNIEKEVIQIDYNNIVRLPPFVGQDCSKFKI